MKLRKISGIFVAAMLITSSFSWTTYASTNPQNYASDTVQNGEKRYIVKFKTKNTDAKQFLSKYNGKVKKQFKHVDATVANMTKQNLDKLKKDPNIAYVEEDNVLKATEIQTNWGVNDINAPASWQAGYTGKGIKIAVIDSGIATHPDLSVAGGVNVISGASSPSYADDNGHGTHVAGVIGGKGINGGVKGVAPDASIYAVKALDSAGSGYTSDIISGIDWAIENKVDIISMSLGSSQSDFSLQNAVDTAYSKGILVVAAAGNDGNADGTGTNVNYPANYASVIAVGAVDSYNKRAAFSSTGSKVEISAPGVSIVSTYLNGGYAQMSGTSMATPFIAGDLALLKQKYPNYTNLQLRQVLDNTVVDLGTAGRDPLYGFGLVQAPTNATSVVTPVVAPVTVPTTPTASLAGGTYNSAQNVTLSDTTSGVSIYYTLDGTIPTKNSSLYSSPITISSTKTLKAIAIDGNGNSSQILSVVYTIVAATPTVSIPTPTASIPAGTYKSPLYIRIYDSYSKPLKAFYTVDGSTPTTKSLPYTGYINITSSCTLKVIAVDYNGNTSGVLSNQYTIIKPPAAPVMTKSGQTITLSDSTKGVSMYYTLDGSNPTSKSTLYKGPMVIKNTTFIKAVAIDASGNSSNVACYLIFGSGGFFRFY